MVRAQRLEDNTGNLKLVSGEPFLQQQKRSSDKVSAETLLTTVRKNYIGKETSKAICLARACDFVSGMIKMSWRVVDVGVTKPPVATAHRPYPSGEGYFGTRVFVAGGSQRGPSPSAFRNLATHGAQLRTCCHLMLEGKLTESFKPVHITFLSPCP